MQEAGQPTDPPAPHLDVLSIGDLARATGLSVETIRMWERRYGRPASLRLPSGHRRYTQDQARWLRRVAEAVASGTRASEAVRADPETLDALLAAAERPDVQVAPEWLDLARRFDAAAVRARLREASSGRTPAAIVSEIVAPLLTAVGRAWADGRIDVRHEHFLAGEITDLLRELRAAAPLHPEGPRVVLTTLPGELHSLGLTMAAVVAAHAGARCVMLGADTPLAEIAAAAREAGATLVAISVSIANGGVDADHAIQELRAMLPGTVRLVAGGAGTRRPRRAPRGIEYVEDLAAFDVLVRSLGGPSR